jgi:hypothetical protein
MRNADFGEGISFLERLFLNTTFVNIQFFGKVLEGLTKSLIP